MNTCKVAVFFWGRSLITICRALALLALCGTSLAHADDAFDWSLHGQMTVVDQYHPAFRADSLGTNSMSNKSLGDETFDATLFLGLRVWDGGEIYADPEIDQGFGLSNTVGMAGFPSGEAYKVGKTDPYFRLQRLFFRQTFDLGGETQNIDSAQNQVAGTRTADNLILTGGKMSVTDIFDTNDYAHDPKNDFLNWALIDSGAFDYAADAWGYSYGIAAEWSQDWWTLRGGLYDLSRVPNSTELETDFSQFEAVAEGEARVTLFGEAGKIKLLGWVNRGRMGDYLDAVALGIATHTTPSTALVREYRTRPGGVINIQQALTDDLGVFARLSLNDGSKEAYEFTEINRSVAAGLAWKGTSWGRKDDTVGFAGIVNGLSHSARDYFAAGGIGILIGDGELAHYGSEDILETYYDAQVTSWLNVSLDYQLAINPAYNRDHGPISLFGGRLHAQW
ncbi:MAG TPA: carbohydrate porin [Rhizomicrobium sp.]|nr:carbohydrate porin [Rhizomicrobium sp.]